MILALNCICLSILINTHTIFFKRISYRVSNLLKQAKEQRLIIPLLLKELYSLNFPLCLRGDIKSFCYLKVKKVRNIDYRSYVYTKPLQANNLIFFFQKNILGVIATTIPAAS